jgi:nucleotide-binding universal stress UspA family protein
MGEKLQKKILVPVDFGEPSLKAAEYACKMAAKFEANLILLYVIDTPGLLAQFFESGDYLVKITAGAKEKMIKLAESLKKKGAVTDIKTRVERGNPYEKILEFSRKEGTFMIILGENHDHEDPDDELGTTVYHVTLKSKVPVLTIKGDTSRMKENIVVPLDLHKKTKDQLSCTLFFGKTQGAKIYLVSTLIGGIDKTESRIYNKLKDSKDFLEKNGLECEMELFDRSDTPPYIRVLEYAEKVDAGMILIMTHEEGYDYNNYIGAFAHHILNMAKVPVMTVSSVADNSYFDSIFKLLIDPVNLFGKK